MPTKKSRSTHQQRLLHSTKHLKGRSCSKLQSQISYPNKLHHQKNRNQPQHQLNHLRRRKPRNKKRRTNSKQLKRLFRKLLLSKRSLSKKWKQCNLSLSRSRSLSSSTLLRRKNLKLSPLSKKKCRPQLLLIQKKIKIRWKNSHLDQTRNTASK